MPEANKAAAILIATSWQARGRLDQGDANTVITDCTVVIVFAAFYIEANLSHIIRTMGKEAELKSIYGDHPGLFSKLKWFFDNFLASGYGITLRGKSYRDAMTVLDGEFPGFEKIHEFRNMVSHGDIDISATNPTDALTLRSNAKAIVEKLFMIVGPIPGLERLETYTSSIGPTTPAIPGPTFQASNNLSSDVSS